MHPLTELHRRRVTTGLHRAVHTGRTFRSYSSTFTHVLPHLWCDGHERGDRDGLRFDEFPDVTDGGAVRQVEHSGVAPGGEVFNRLLPLPVTNDVQPVTCYMSWWVEGCVECVTLG